MVKTHPHSRFALKSLNQIRDSVEVVLQIEKTASQFTNTKEEVFLCEVVSSSNYNPSDTVIKLSDEIVKVNAENRRLRKKIEQYERRGC
jgi:hypothetical protein